MRPLFRSRTAWLLACAALAACGDSTSPAPETAAQAEVDAVLGQMAAASSAGAGAASLSGGGTSSANSQAQSSEGCVYNGSTKFFVCPARTVDGITINASFQLLDASNTPQDHFDEKTTAAVRQVSDASGTKQVTSGPMTATQTMTDHSDYVISGILTKNYTLNGTGNMTASIVPNTGPSVNITATMTMTNLVLPPPPSGNAQPSSPVWPLSGSVSMQSTQTPSGGAPMSVNTVTTFNGTSIATIQLTINGTTQTCTHDMSNPAVPPVCQGAPGP